ncbi:MAG TPA: hypothetical protein DCX22_02790, partial [Dehalococcoidia bacterium]|nr:hypothetical protein [Dehalococcoidia bacterium]
SVGPVPGGSGGCSIMIISAQQNADSPASIVFTPHELWATNVFDITSMLPDADGDYKLKFYFTKNHKIDFIGIDTTPETEKEIRVLSPVMADNSQASVLDRTMTIDGEYAVMKQGDELTVTFAEQPQGDKSGMKKSFIFVSKGYYIPDK